MPKDKKCLLDIYIIMIHNILLLQKNIHIIIIYYNYWGKLLKHV